LDTIKQRIQRYEELKDTIKRNAEIEEQLSELQREQSQLTKQVESCNSRMRAIHGKILIAKETVKTITETMEHAKLLEEQFEAYSYYMQAIDRDGVPYELISRVIPELESEVNNILGQMVDFSLVWQLDGKNVNVFIAYDENRTWPLDLTSGMERFISNIAIRTALMNISSLPRPNFLAIDEGFASLDSDNMNSVYLLMEYLKSKFDFILIITHLDTLKDVVDSVLEVKKDSDGFSVVQYE
jgi:DNA repair exonuclease SbcCD ATPase subunit